MTRAIHRMTSGRLRVWCMSHGQQFRLAIALVALVLIYGTVSHFDYQDAIEVERMARRDMAEQLRQERIARALPSTVYIIEAATPAEAQTKFARIAGDADVERYRLREGK